MKSCQIKLAMVSLLCLSLMKLHAFSKSAVHVENNALIYDEIIVTVWDGDNWSHSTPNITTIAILSGDYNTGDYGSFSALSLTINEGITLIIDNDTFVQVKTNTTVDGEIIVQSKGAFIQIDDDGEFYLGDNARTVVNKRTSLLNHWYDYTYWSSPVNGITVGQAFASSNASRRFWFNAENYLDVQAEIGNTGVYEPGHDDIDDNGDDWTLLNVAEQLVPGVGYATTHSSSGFVAGNSYQYKFEGAFNTGTITTPVYYNGDNGDNDWNFIGNPYPSAIDVDVFFEENEEIIGGAVYLWAHGTGPSSGASGNETYNFSNDDYAIINAGSGEVAGGTSVIPNRYIPSGQGFFVQGLTNGNVTFTNAMRVKDSIGNSQFFRQSSVSGNKVWLSLSTNNGAFNQILVAYSDNATDADDGAYYDAKRNLSTNTAAIIYTTIPGEENQKYAIQGKASSSLTTNEVIPVGFYTAITEATLYTFSIPKKQGAFFDVNTVYLKDNLLDSIHDLSASDYVFTSDAGEFSSRFEIVFSNETLGLNNSTLDRLIITELQNGQLRFEMADLQVMDSIGLYDTLGRLIFQKHTNNTKEILHIPNLSKAAYVARIILHNGQTITKKIIKRF